MKFKRVDKRVARSIAQYGEGQGVYISPVLLAPDRYNLELMIFGSYVDFDEVVEEYAKENCNREVGRYPAFYIEDQENE